MNRVWPLAVVLALAAVAGPAQAQGSSSLLFAFGSGRVVSDVSIPVRARGDLVVSFHGDTAAGCAAYGLCAYSGSIVVRPRTGEVDVVTIRQQRRLRHIVLFSLGAGAGPGYNTSARVQRSLPGEPATTCADAPGSVLGGLATAVTHGHSVTIRLLDRGGSLLQTRCAGPLDGDLAAASPAVTLPISRLSRGRMTLGLGGTRTFSVHGFSGTVSSTLTMKLAKPRSEPTSATPSPGSKSHQVRVVTEHLRLVRIRGELGAAVRGTNNPVVCAVLDTCGLTGTLSFRSVAHDASAEVVAFGSARRPYRDFLTALGLSRSGRAHGIMVSLQAVSSGDVRTSASQPGGTCTDTAATGGVSFSSGSGSGVSGGFFGTWRTRCPGPIFGLGALALRGSFDRAALGRTQFTIGLRSTGSFADDGYAVTPHGRLSILLRRGRITQQVTSEPTG